MRIGLLIAGFLSLAVAGCASNLSTAREYAALGKHEFAVCYLGGHYRADRGPQARAELVQGIENARRSLEASYQDLIDRGLAAAALGAATRLEGLIDYARVLGLSEFAAFDGARLVKQALPRALDQAVRAVDRAEADGRPAREQTALLRTALAFDPHNPELAERYERTRSSLKLNLAMQPGCQARHRAACREFLDRLAARLSEERREFTQLVDPASPIKNAELVATLTVTIGDSDWRQTRSGRAEREIEVKNKFKEPKLDAQGNKILEKVQARYQVFERTARAEVALKLQIRDLRPPGKLIFEEDRQLKELDRRSYITWTGDQRALGDLARVGTDQSPPADPQDLARTAAHKLADSLAKQVLEKLEGAGK